MKKSVLLAAGACLIAGSAFAGDTCWSVEYNGGLNTIGTFDTDNPAVINNIGNMGISDFVNSLEFDGSGNLYASNGFTLYSIDQGSGAATAIGGHGSVGSSGITDMSWDPATNTMYGIGTSCGVDGSTYTIDLGSGAASVVCATTVPGACDIGLAFDGNGNLFAHDLVSDTIYTIDSNCGTSTYIALPFDSNFGQGLTANTGTGTCYHVAFNNSAFLAELYEFDDSGAGSYSLIGAFSVLQIAGADIQEGAGDCLSMSVGRLIAGGRTTWDVSGATPNTEVAIVYAFAPGNFSVNGTLGYCATFGLDRVSPQRLICRQRSNGAGEISCSRPIPGSARGVRVLTQAAEKGTCPDECVSNVDDQVVQ